MIIETGQYGELESVVSVQYEDTDDPKATEAILELMSRSEATGVELNESIQIKDNDNNVKWSGNIREVPKGLSKSKYTLKAEGSYSKLFGEDASKRVLVNEDKGDVIDSLLRYEAGDDIEEIAYSFDSLSDVSNPNSNFSNFELSNFIEHPLNEYGTDVLYADWNKDNTDANKGDYNIVVDNVTYSGDELAFLNCLIYANTGVNLFKFTFTYYDSSESVVYRWTRNDIGVDKNYKLQPEKAEILQPSDVTLNADQSEININLKGSTISPKAVCVDVLKTVSHDLKQRNKFNSITIPQVGEKITRRFSGTLSEALYQITTDTDYKVTIDENNNAELLEKGSEEADLTIEQGDKDIIDVIVKDDTTDIYNRVVVEGSDDTDFIIKQQVDQSIEFYGKVKTKQIREESITKRKDAEKRARRFLKENAFDDGFLGFVYNDVSVYDEVEVGNSIDVNFPSVNAVGKYTVAEIERDESTVTIYL